MGKGTRKRENALQQQAELAVKFTAAKKRKRIVKIAVTALCIALVIGIAAVGAAFGVINHRVKTGYYLRNTTCGMSDNHNISNAALAYYFTVEYSDFRSKNQNQLSAMGVDTGKPLKEQKCTYYDGYDTWYDYIMEQTKSRIINIMCYANAAKGEGLELDKDDKSSVDNKINELKKTAESANKTLDEYISDTFGEGLNEADIRNCFELTALSQKYYNKYEQSLKYTDSELESYYEKNSNKFDVVSYKSYTFESDRTDSGSNSKALQMFLKNAKSDAEKLKNVTSVDEYDKVLCSYLVAYYKARGKEMTDEEINGTVKNTLTEDYEYNEGGSITKWAFDSSRKVGDTYMTENVDEHTYTVYILTKTRHRLDYNTKNVRHILITAETYGDNAEALSMAQTLLDKIREKDDFESAFIGYAKEYSEDSGSSSNGGLYENIAKGEMVTEFDQWCYYSGRKRGDSAVIKTDYGYHVMYFVGNGLKKWQADATDDMKADDFKQLIEDLTAKYSVKFDKDAAYKLDM